MSFEKVEIVKYRFERAYEAIIEAKALAEIGHWNTVANRLYYACFYAVIGLLLNDGYQTKTHDGARRILNLNYVKTGLLSTLE